MTLTFKTLKSICTICISLCLFSVYEVWNLCVKTFWAIIFQLSINETCRNDIDLLTSKSIVMCRFLSFILHRVWSMNFLRWNFLYYDMWMEYARLTFPFFSLHRVWVLPLQRWWIMLHVLSIVNWVKVTIRCRRLAVLAWQYRYLPSPVEGQWSAVFQPLYGNGTFSGMNITI